MIDAKEEEFLRRIHPCAAVAGSVLNVFAKYPYNWPNEDFIVTASNIPRTKRQKGFEVLSNLVDLTILQCNANHWMGAKTSEELQSHALVAETLGVYLEKIHRDDNTVELVVTKPRQPSVLDRFLLASQHVAGYPFLFSSTIMNFPG